MIVLIQYYYTVSLLIYKDPQLLVHNPKKPKNVYFRQLKKVWKKARKKPSTASTVVPFLFIVLIIDELSTCSVCCIYDKLLHNYFVSNWFYCHTAIPHISINSKTLHICYLSDGNVIFKMFLTVSITNMFGKYQLVTVGYVLCNMQAQAPA